MNNTEFYKKKYLKYKAKYLELKGGGTPPWAENLKNILIKYKNENGMTYEELNSNLLIFKGKGNGKKLYYYDELEDQKTFEIIKVNESKSTLTITSKLFTSGFASENIEVKVFWSKSTLFLEGNITEI